MSEYIKNIQRMFLLSEKTVIVFCNGENVWCNKKPDFFGGQIPSYNDIEIRGMKKDDENILFNVIIHTEDLVLVGEMSNIEDDGKNYCTVILEVKNIMEEAFENVLFQKYMESNNIYIKSAVNEIEAYISLIREGIAKKKELPEFYDGIEHSCMG